MTRWRAIAAGVVIGTAAGTLVASAATRDPARPPGPDATPVRPALRIPSPQALGSEPDLTRWAPVVRSVNARAAPAPTAHVVVRVARLTPEGTETPLPILGRRADARGRLWIRVRLPVLPNGTTGWVRRRALGAYEAMHDRLVVDRRRLRATLLQRGKAVLSMPIGIGLSRWPTPPGQFIVRNRLTRYRSPAYGPIAFGLSARSPTLTGWPAGGFIGIHGTDQPDHVPGRVSHGCIRLRNADILSLAALLRVGTPVTVL
jgi:hypothetical protein